MTDLRRTQRQTRGGTRSDTKAHNADPDNVADADSVAPSTVETVDVDDLFASHGAACYALAIKILRDPQLAQDVVQEAFLAHWNTAAFDATRGTHHSWLLMLTHRKAVDRVRHEQIRRSLPLEAFPEPVSPRRGPEDLALAHVQGAKVRAALGTLTLTQQEALNLAYWGGYTQGEIAEITRTPIGTVKGRMRTGMLSLREALAGEFA